jgi:hypothetical protein
MLKFEIRYVTVGRQVAAYSQYCSFVIVGLRHN